MNALTTRGANRPHRQRLSAAVVLVVFLLAASSAQADYVFTTVNYPGAAYTDVRGINSTGQIVGYTDLGAFRYSGGTYSLLPPAPGGLQTSAHGINDDGLIIGSAGPVDDSSSVGFILDGATYGYFSYPGRSHTHPRSINNAGMVTGYAINADGSGNVGFIYDPVARTFTDVAAPSGSFVIAQGINTAGQVTGSAIIPGQGRNGFLRAPDGTMSYFKVSGGGTAARGINNAGLLTGFYYDNSSASFNAFVGSSAGYQQLRAGPTQHTYAQAINDSGQISGLFVDVSDTAFNPRGFIATPAALPTGTSSSGAYTFSAAVVANVETYIDPQVTLGYEYRIGPDNPQFATVRLPIGIGDNHYMLLVNGKSFPLAAGVLFDFGQHGYAGGVAAFRVTDIESSAALNPSDPYAFPTQLTFSGSGRFTGTMQPLCPRHALPTRAPAEAMRRALANCIL